MSVKSSWTQEQALSQLRRWCTTQDRCQNEVRTKLIEHQVYGDHLENILTELITEGFVNEERFAKNYARGKFRMMNWGRNKILQGLKFHKISSYCIKKAMEEIDLDEYDHTLKTLLLKKWNLLKNSTSQETFKKLLSYAQQKGFESELIVPMLKELLVR